jgi:E3 ubiquitin-protein ligase EDD1
VDRVRTNRMAGKVNFSLCCLTCTKYFFNLCCSFPAPNCRQGQGEAALFSDEESDGGGESSHGEEEDEDESEGDGGETADEHDDEEEDEFTFTADDQLERRSVAPSGVINAAAAGHNDRASLAPQHMQWALRPRSKGRGIAPAGGSGAAAAAAAAAANAGGGFIYIDPSSLRRSAAGSSSAAAAVAAAAASGAAVAAESATMATTASALSRAFGIVIRQIADLLTMLQDYSTMAPALPRVLVVDAEEFHSLMNYVEKKLLPNWMWLMTVMDSTEAQLRFGATLANAVDPSHPNHPLHTTQRSRSDRSGFQTRYKQ